MIRIQAWNEFVSVKFSGPLAIWPWLRISPQSSLNVIYLIITGWQCLMSFPYMPCIPMQKPIKACQGKGRGTRPLRECWCCPFSSSGLGSPCDLVLSQPQRRGHCLLVMVLGSYNQVIDLQWKYTLLSERNCNRNEMQVSFFTSPFTPTLPIIYQRL